MNLNKFNVCVISHRRPLNVSKMNECVNIPLNWYVGDNKDKDDYKTDVIVGGNLCESRNRILKDSWEQDKIAVMIDDDIKGLKECYIENGKKTTRDITLSEALDIMYKSLNNTRLKLAGVSPTHNPFFCNPNKPIQLKHFIVASMCMVKPCELYFDESFRTKEDYDYTLQHIKKFGGVTRCDTILANFEHYNNAGGVVDYRTDEVEKDSIDKLKNKWGELISDNTRRPNEILIKYNLIK